jgi:hypothetical protein
MTRTSSRFLIVAFAWTAVIALPLIALELLPSGTDRPRIALTLGRVLVFAAYPAGIAAARDVLGARPWRAIAGAGTGATMLAITVLLSLAWLPELLGPRGTGFASLVATMHSAGSQWETLNDAGWRYYGAFVASAQAMLYAAIGVQVGLWVPRAVATSFRRLLYWAIGLGILVSAVTVTDATYELVVLHTAADARISVLYALLLPLGIAAGLSLPTFALLRRGDVLDARRD